VLSVWRAQASRSLRLAPKDKRPARLLLPSVPVRVRKGALSGESPALYRSSWEGETEADARAHALPPRIFQDASVRRLRGARSSRAGVRPPTRQVLCDRPFPLTQRMARHTRRDQEVPGRLRELPSPSHCEAQGLSTGSADSRLWRRVENESGRRGSNPHPRAWKARVRPVTPRPPRASIIGLGRGLTGSGDQPRLKPKSVV
jgi:hypothetical protein